MTEPVRFLTDENIDRRIVAGVRRRQPATDILTASEAGIRTWPDPDVLAFAVAQNRVLVSNDRHTMPGHFAAHLAAGRRSPGVLLLRRAVPIRQIVDEILLIWGASDHQEWRDTLKYLPL